MEDRGDLVGAMVVEDDDEVLVVMQSGNVVRSAVEGVPSKGRDTMGVIFAKPRKKDRIIKVARSSGATLAATGEEAGDEAEGNDAVTPDAAPSESEGTDQTDAVALDSDQASTEQAPESEKSDGGHQ